MTPSFWNGSSFVLSLSGKKSSCVYDSLVKQEIGGVEAFSLPAVSMVSLENRDNSKQRGEGDIAESHTHGTYILYTRACAQISLDELNHVPRAGC